MITASVVKELRQISGAGMMDCKKALQEANGDTEKAMVILRKNGIAKAEKKQEELLLKAQLFHISTQVASLVFCLRSIVKLILWQELRVFKSFVKMSQCTLPQLVLWQLEKKN